MEFSRQEYWSRLPFPFPEDLPDPGTEPTSLTFATLAGRFFTTGHLGSQRIPLPVCILGHFRFVTPWTVTHQAPLTMGFSRQEYWAAVPSSRGSSLPRDQTWRFSAGGFFTVGPPRKPVDPLRCCQFSLVIVGAGGSACRSSPESEPLWCWVSWTPRCPKNRACDPGRG